MAALYVRFGGSHPYVRHTNVLTGRSSSDSALWERGVSCFFKVLVPQSRGVAKVARRNPARPGPDRGLEVAHDIPPHSPGYRQADWHDWGAPGAILISTKTLLSVKHFVLRPSGGPICPVLGPTHTCDIPMCSPAVPPAIPPCGGAEGAVFLKFRSLKVGVSQR